MRHAAWKPVFILGLALSWSWAAAGQTTTCPNTSQGLELVNPPEIVASGGGLSTTFDVQEKTLCVPSKKQSDGVTWTQVPMTLRTYVYPDPKTGAPAWGFPGPTLRLRKAMEPGGKGQFLAILLKNSLPYPVDNECQSACSSGTSCNCDPAAVDALIAQCANQTTAACCCIINCTQKSPNCFHGDNVTNLHFHGSHASPQEPQDFVLLDLWPAKPAGAAEPQNVHASHGPYSKVVFGQYQYRVDPFDWTQAEGTHWYHPHKHGSVGLQVANGMAGALVIEGPFDDWLKQYYDPVKGEKLMVIQSITSGEPLFQQNTPGAQILVNGQIQPKITVNPGEIQRWRIVNATMSSNTLLKITFPAGVVFRQIAMDGVRFSSVNYECQPLLNFSTANPSFPCQPNVTGTPSLTIAPGNRADFLVQVPLTETAKGSEGLRVERQLVNIRGEEEHGAQRKLLRARDEELAPGAAEPALFHLHVDDGIEGNDDQPKKLAAGAKTLPTTLPPMPDYLTNITDDQVKGNSVGMTFQQFVAGKTDPWPYAASPLSQFKISGLQFNPDCANVTTRVDTAAEWTVGNDTLLPHPFHIHTNPFQLVSYKGVPVQAAGQKKPEPIWMDTLMLPTATVTPASAPKVPKPDPPIQITTASMVFRQRYLAFTGEYVLHCHFLGHEDRGMMFAVQTVCKDKPGFYGKAGVPAPECQGELLPAVPACK